MKYRNNRSVVGVALVLFFALLVFFTVRLGTHRPPAVNLPQFDQSERGDVSQHEGTEAVRRVEVTPETVQLVIERLARPANYSRALLIERFWSGGSGTAAVQTYTADGWTRTDLTISDMETRHSITNGADSWIWYGDEGRVFQGSAALSADEEQSIPTYENILRLEPKQIAVADYRAFETVNCIYVATEPDESGYSEHFWIAVENGLLVASERRQGDTLVWRMTGLAVERDTVDAAPFTLPNGTVLFAPGAADEGSEQQKSEG